nr:DUF1894 domain-containing protein [Methanolinea mesophila]
MVFRCINNLGDRFAIKDGTPEEVNRYIRTHCSEFVEIPPDVVIFRETRISLACPMLVGLDEKSGKIYLPFSKRCMGTFLVEIDARKEEFSFFRDQVGRIEESLDAGCGPGRSSPEKVAGAPEKNIKRVGRTSGSK